MAVPREKKPGRRVTVDLRNATLDEALDAVLGPLRLEYEIRDGGTDLRISTVTLDLEKASFWEAMDEVTDVARVDALGHDIPFPLRAGCHALRSKPAFRWPFRWDTIGDVRVFAGPVVMGGGGADHGDITVRLSAVFPPWAVPERVRFESVRIAGQSIAEEDRMRPHWGAEKPPCAPKKLTITGEWSGKNTVRRESLKGADVLTVDGTLVVTGASGKGDKELRVPFSIQDLPVLPIPSLPKR